ncbi:MULTISPECIES: hemolysin family protein [unclassified Nocardioides]|uniref:hemolysin family protein n=1 Tax=unclassified Nocardioides TaxID=2615069 RepID=UPI0009F0ABEF|nr:MULTISPECIES: hemolysin family protein [unclassified Nocardioides]GAW52261.1 CBS-pair_CorC_Hly-domain- (transporter associated domain-) containing protein [Nocardioides sp. PD653-B2]GAW56054.1 CBS-pair_CorC_Hly-domain- (transporter associated domain-) containing protein [Nocardioides sp. PD653]
MSDYLPGLVSLVVLLAGNAFFVGAEFAVISARRSQIEPRAAEGSRAAKSTLYAMEHATLMLATSQLGITVCSLLILTVSEPAIHHLLEHPLGATPLTPDAIGVVAFIVALVLVTYLHVVFGEMVPKNTAFSVPERAALLLAPPLVLVSRIFRPIIWALNWVANGVVRLCGVQPKDEATSTFTLEEVAGIVQRSQREGVLADTAGTLAGAFEFTTKRVAEEEVPLGEVVLLPYGVTPAQVHQAVVEHGYSRYVVQDRSGEPSGYLHVKDVMDLDTAFDTAIPAKRIRRLVSVQRDAELEDAMRRLRQLGTHVARTVDEDGATTGLLFLEDVLEVLVGEVDDATTRR